MKNIAASVRRRLLNQARATESDFNKLLERYTRERFLYRLSQSQQADKFILKGASVFQVWLGNPHRNTNDIDLLGFGSNEPQEMERMFAKILQQPCDDGIKFTEVKSSILQVGQKYEGVRLNIDGKLDTAKLRLQVDIGYGHVITPPAKVEKVPTLLDLPSPSLLVYPKETVIAEKFQAICQRGLKNSRVKDYFDLYYLKNHFEFEEKLLQEAIANTFDRRQTPIPSATPIGLTQQYIDSNAGRQNQWQKFIVQSKVKNFPNLRNGILQIANFIMPVTKEIGKESQIPKRWRPNQGWELMNRFEKYNDTEKTQNKSIEQSSKSRIELD